MERHITTSATLPQCADKAFLDANDNYSVKWESGDALNINGTNLPLASLNADATKANFEGTAYAITSGGNDIYWAVYPTTSAGAASGSTIPSNFTANRLTVTLPDVQTFDLSQTKILEDATYMAAKATVPAGQTSLNLSMKNLCAVMKIHLSATGVSNTNVERIVFSSSSRLNGDFYFDGSAVTASTASTCNQLTVNLTDGTHSYIDISGGVDVYVILPPISSSKLSMTVHNTDGGFVTKTATTATLASNTIYTSALNISAFTTPDYSITVNASGKKVLFAPGNLQWSATNGGSTATTHTVAGGGTDEGTWRFAEHQWDYVGDATLGTVYAGGVKCDNALISQNYTGWIDLFGWGTSGYHDANDNDNTQYKPYSKNAAACYGPSASMTDHGLVGTSANYDWGVYNAIYNPTTNTNDPAGTWRTLTTAEWSYIIGTRSTTSGVRFAKAIVNEICGLIIVPDNWDNCTYYTLRETHSPAVNYTSNVISLTTWNALEKAGCVFLPAGGFRNNSTCNIDQSLGFYWSTDESYNSWYARYLNFSNTILDNGVHYNRYYGRSVRLVKDVQ